MSSTSNKTDKSDKINGDYLRGVSPKRLGGLMYLARLAGRNKVNKLEKDDFEKFDLCWAYSFPKKKRESYTDAKRAAYERPGTEAFPCSVCFSWHVGSTPTSYRAREAGEGPYVVEPTEEPVVFGPSKVEIKPASKKRLKKLNERKNKYV